MIAGLLGKKLGMTQLFKENGEHVPVTVIEAGPCHVMQIKTQKIDGYNAVQLGFDDRKRKRATKPESGHARKAKVEPKHFVREVDIEGDENIELGQTITVEIFDQFDSVDIIGTTKGKGFQGCIKRHGFSGGPASHGASKVHRSPGSIGQSAAPSRTFKGVRMPGHMGHVRCTVQNLKVIEIDLNKNLLMVKGAVPGPNGSYVIVHPRAAKKE